MLRKGDIVTIQGRVRWDVREDDKRVTLEIESAIDQVSVDVSCVRIFRKELRVGDRVVVGGGPPATILAVDGDDLFVRNENGMAGTLSNIIATRVDDKKEPTNGID